MQNLFGSRPKTRKNKEEIFKMIIFGKKKAGKSALVTRLVEESYSGTHQPLPKNVDFIMKPMPEQKAKLMVWDHPRSSEGREILAHEMVNSAAFFRGSEILALVVKTSQVGSEIYLSDLFRAIEESKDNPYREYILVSNVDKTKPRQFTTEEAEQWATKHNMMFVEVDATEDVGPILIEKLKEALDKVLLNIDRFPKNTTQRAAPQPVQALPPATQSYCTLI